MDTPPGASGDARTFTARLQKLFAERRNPATGRPYTDGEVAAHIGLSKTAVWNLHTGRADNPSRETITALAAFFGVSPGYFFGGDDEADGELQRLLADVGVRHIAARAADLTPDGRDMLIGILEQIRRMENKG